MSLSKDNINVSNSAELLSYIINQSPVLRENIDLPKQGESIAPIGKLILNNQRYRNAFLNVVNLIGLTVITRNNWDEPWIEFTMKGTLSWGQQVREIISDIANVYDYNQEFANDEKRFLKTVVPNVLEYIHDINFQKVYQTTVSDEQMAMAFEQGDLFSIIDVIVNSLFEGLKYDRYIVNKYMLQRRILDGTMTAVQITDFATKSNREIVADIKAVSNKMTFRSPNYNPAGLRKATRFDDQFAIVSTDFDAIFTTDVLATSYFKSDAELKANMALIDSFGDNDAERLAELFAAKDSSGNVIADTYIDGYVPLTDAEKLALAEIPAVIVGRDFFQDYYYGMSAEEDTDEVSGARTGKSTEFYNPGSLKKNQFLHYWGVMSTSPFENAAVFTQTAQAVSSVAVSPSSANLTKGQSLKLSANVTTTGFANKSVAWDINSEAVTKGATITQDGVLSVPSSYVTTGSETLGVYTISIDTTAMSTNDTVTVNGVTYTVAAADDTIAKQITAMKTAFNTAAITDYFTISGTSTTTTLTEKSGHGGTTPAPTFVSSAEQCEIEETTEGAIAGNKLLVTAVSVYDKDVYGNALITIS